MSSWRAGRAPLEMDKIWEPLPAERGSYPSVIVVKQRGGNCKGERNRERRRAWSNHRTHGPFRATYSNNMSIRHENKHMIQALVIFGESKESVWWRREVKARAWSVGDVPFQYCHRRVLRVIGTEQSIFPEETEVLDRRTPGYAFFVSHLTICRLQTM